MRWNWNLIGEARAKPLNNADRCTIVRVTSNRDRLINRADKWRNGATSLKRIAMTAKWLKNLKSDVPRTNSNMLCIADAKIDVTDIRTIRSQNAKVISRDKVA